MFLPPAHLQSSIPALRQLIQDSPLGILTTVVLLDTYPLIQVGHIPILLDVNNESSETELGTLRGYMARQNPQSRALADAVALFYAKTKPTTAKVAPIWNYAIALVYGRAKIYYDFESQETAEFLLQLHDLLKHGEESTMGYSSNDGRLEPWKVSEASEQWLALLKTNIIGIEISITRLEGKFKISQEMRKGDRDGVVRGFEGLESETGLAIASMIRERDE